LGRPEDRHGRDLVGLDDAAADRDDRRLRQWNHGHGLGAFAGEDDEHLGTFYTSADRLAVGYL
jgi:hypothetical protein